MMVGVKRSVMEVSGGPRACTSKFKTIYSSGCWSGTTLCDPVASKDPCWSSFLLSGGEGGSSVTGDRP
jgi:hypothetical protein